MFLELKMTFSSASMPQSNIAILKVRVHHTRCNNEKTSTIKQTIRDAKSSPALDTRYASMIEHSLEEDVGTTTNIRKFEEALIP